MTLWHKLMRRLGKEYKLTISTEYPRYRYTVTHLNGETSEAIASRHRRDEGFLLLYKPEKSGWSRLTVTDPHNRFSPSKPFNAFHGYTGQGWEVVRELEGVQEVERERRGSYHFELTIDRAEDEIVDVKKITDVDGIYKGRQKTSESANG